jgi:hypothetical protein
MAQGLAPDSQEMQQVTERPWRHIDITYYSCPPEMFAQLAEMWVADPRFAARYDEIRPGLAAYVRDAARAWVAGKLR